MQGFYHVALLWSLGDILQGCMVSLGQYVGTPEHHVWIILGAWHQLGTTWADMLSPERWTSYCNLLHMLSKRANGVELRQVKWTLYCNLY